MMYAISLRDSSVFSLIQRHQLPSARARAAVKLCSNKCL